MKSPGPADARDAALRRVGELVVRAQTADADVLDEIVAERAVADAAGWADVGLALLHAQAVHGWSHSLDGVDELIEHFEAEAKRLDMRAYQGVALVDRIHHERSRSGRAPFPLYARARVLLSDTTEPAAPRLSGLINLALELSMIGLDAMSDRMLHDAAEVAHQLPDDAQARAVIANNRVNRLLRCAARDLMVGDVESAKSLLGRSDLVMSTLDTTLLPPAWLAQLRVHRRVVAAVLADADVAADEVAWLNDGLAGVDAGYALLLRLVRPLADQTDPPTREQLDAHESSEFAWYLHVRALRRGAAPADQLLRATEHFNAVVLDRAVRTTTELEAGVAAMIEAQVLAQERGDLIAQAHTDALTGLGNRRSFERCLDDADGAPTSLVVFDLDHFDDVNDHHGHHAGDLVLQGFARVLLDATAAFEPLEVARLGGDEFAVVVAGADRARARSLVMAVTGRMAEHDWPLPDAPTASAGIGTHHHRDELLRTADADLYRRTARCAAPADDAERRRRPLSQTA